MDWYAQNAKYHNKMTKKAKERKDTPVFSGVLNYFPDAIREVAKVSFQGNEQHNPGSELHWDRSKSGDEKDALTRHLLDAGTRDDDGMLHSAKVAWRALAMLQKELESIEHEQWQNAMIAQSEIEDRMYPIDEDLINDGSEDLEGSVSYDLAKIREEELEKRMDIIGQNGNDGLHYDEVSTSLSDYPESNWTEDNSFNIKDAKVTIDGGI